MSDLKSPPDERHPAETAPAAPPHIPREITREPAPAPAPDPEQERIREERAQYARDRELWMAEREQTRRWQAQVESRLPPPPRQEEPDLDRIWYENPSLAARIIEERTAQRLTHQYRQDQEANRREQVMKEFVGGMYESHPELRGEDQLVAYVLQRDGERIGALKIPEAREALAKGVRDEIFRMEKRAGDMRTREEGREPPAASRAVVEGGSGSSREGARTPREREEAGGPKSLTDLLRQRREARDEARHRVGRRTG
jgi:hypothetical protein